MLCAVFGTTTPLDNVMLGELVCPEPAVTPGPEFVPVAGIATDSGDTGADAG